MMKKEENIWDDIHSKLHNDILKQSSYAEISEKLFPKNSLVCDLGGGLGFDALYFIKKGHRVVVLDISNYALNHVKDLIKKEKLVKKLLIKQVDFGLGKLPLKDKTFNVVYSRIGLNYFPYRETQIMFSEIYRILKPGGTAYLILKSPDDREEMKFLTEHSVKMEDGVFIEGQQIRSRFNLNQLETMLDEISIKYFIVKAYQEKDDVLRNENNVSKDKILYLNEVIFKKS
jgi:ubiquinone/menaquinone biosynthesis C-methylase UbiE